MTWPKDRKRHELASKGVTTTIKKGVNVVKDVGRWVKHPFKELKFKFYVGAHVYYRDTYQPGVVLQLITTEQELVNILRKYNKKVEKGLTVSNKYVLVGLEDGTRRITPESKLEFDRS